MYDIWPTSYPIQAAKIYDRDVFNAIANWSSDVWADIIADLSDSAHPVPVPRLRNFVGESGDSDLVDACCNHFVSKEPLDARAMEIIASFDYFKDYPKSRAAFAIARTNRFGAEEMLREFGVTFFGDLVDKAPFALGCFAVDATLLDRDVDDGWWMVTGGDDTTFPAVRSAVEALLDAFEPLVVEKDGRDGWKIWLARVLKGGLEGCNTTAYVALGLAIGNDDGQLGGEDLVSLVQTEPLLDQIFGTEGVIEAFVEGLNVPDDDKYFRFYGAFVADASAA